LSTPPPRDEAEALRLRALQSESEGRLDDADRLWGQVIEIAPGDATSIDALIGLSHRRADFGRLVHALLARLNLTPWQGELWSDLGAALERLGRVSMAQAAYKRALAVSPSFPAALLNLAFQSYHSGEPADAARLSRRAAAAGAAPGIAMLIEAHSAQLLGQAERARRGYAAALAFNPSECLAWQGLGSLLLAQTQTGHAQTSFARAVAVQPADATGLANLAEADRRGRTFGRAARFSRRALSLAPDSIVARNALALTCADTARDVEALVSAQRAVALDGRRPDLLVNLGVALKTLGRFEAAERAIRLGLAARPHDPDFHMSLATALLAMGRIEDGLAEYEWRHASRPSRYDVFRAPRWDGRRLEDGRLLVWGEQGVGDEILFAQYLKDALTLAPQIIVECDPRLVSIFKRSFPAIAFVPRTSSPDPQLFDRRIVAQVALGSIPHALGFALQDLRSKGPYLVPDPGRAEAMAKRLAGIEGLKVGIAWRSRDMESAVSKRLHATLADITPVLRTTGARAINIQYGDLGCSLREFNAAHPDHPIIAFDDLDLMNDLEGVLALGSQLDLVISTATSAYCLPAATGTETWLLLARISYLSFGQSDGLCCPRSRGFIRDPGQSWAGPVEQVVEALDRRLRLAGST
jgi:Flp pilus assembly protein TadD